MTNTNVEKGNRLIGEFMGLKVHENGSISVGQLMNGEEMQALLLYDSDWNKLMPACYKFDTLYQDIKLDRRTYKKYELLCDDIDRAVTLYEIPLVFDSLVRGIQWYNRVTAVQGSVANEAEK